MARFNLERILGEMRGELERSMSIRMPHQEEVLPEYLSYHFTRIQSVAILGDIGSCRGCSKAHASIGTEMLVGREGDSAGGYAHDYHSFFRNPGEGSLATAFWRLTDDVFKSAVKSYLSRKKVKLLLPRSKSSKGLKFLRVAPVRHIEDAPELGVDVGEWKRLVRGCTGLFSEYGLSSSSLEFDASRITNIIVNSEGSEIVTNSVYYSITMDAEAVCSSKSRAGDGSIIEVSRKIYVADPSELPSREGLENAVRSMLEELCALSKAPVQRPLERPAVVDRELSAQLFYTVLANSVLGRCNGLFLPEEGRAKKGDKVFPDFISMCDDPSQVSFACYDGKSRSLSGRMLFDEQGCPSRAVELVKAGAINEFPCGREYIEGLAMPNGHARFDGEDPLPGITNLFISSERAESREDLVERLIGCCQKEGFDYGFLLVGSSGSEFDGEENCYNITPRLAYRVWAKDALDKDTGQRFRKGDLQLVRDAEVVGNPSITMANLEMMGNDRSVTVPDVIDGIDNVYHGEDSCIVCPSAYFTRLELKRQMYSKLRPPLISPPSGRVKGGR